MPCSKCTISEPLVLILSDTYMISKTITQYKIVTIIKWGPGLFLKI
nr:gustatory receptor [Semanotus bifasciatus]